VNAGGALDHQFFNVERLDEIEKIETQWLAYEADPDAWIEKGNPKPAEYT